MIDPTKPLETVPDGRNPVPVPCEYRGPTHTGQHMAQTLGDWFNEFHVNLRNRIVWFGDDGRLDLGDSEFLHIRNVQLPSTAKAPDAECVEQDARDAVIAEFVAACEAYCAAYDAGTGTVYVEPMIRAAIARAKEMMK